MIQRIKQTEEEKIKMYMKSSKKELVKMLINCNNILEQIPITIKIDKDIKTQI